MDKVHNIPVHTGLIRLPPKISPIMQQLNITKIFFTPITGNSSNPRIGFKLDSSAY